MLRIVPMTLRATAWNGESSPPKIVVTVSVATLRKKRCQCFAISLVPAIKLVSLPLIKDQLQLVNDSNRDLPHTIMKIKIGHGSRACGQF
jgi:hypothetical protein